MEKCDECRNCNECRERLEAIRSLEYTFDYYEKLCKYFQEQFESNDNLPEEDACFREDAIYMLHKIRHDIHITRCMVARSGINLNSGQQAATRHFLRKIAQKAIETHEYDKIVFVRDCLIDGNYDKDILTPIVEELEDAMKLYPPTVPVQEVDDMERERYENAVNQLVPLFRNNRAMTEQFVNSISGQSNMSVTATVNNYAQCITPNTKKVDLWRILYENRYYTASQTNFRNQVNTF